MSLQGCRHRGAKSGASVADRPTLTPPAARESGTRRVLLDGSFDDWPSDRSMLGDPDWVYFRVRLEGGVMPLQAGNETLSLWLDADGDPTTGAKMPEPAEAGTLGVDLVVEFSPIGEQGGISRGARAIAYDAAGANRTVLKASSVGVLAAPTYGASEFEVRLDRHSEQGKRFARGMGERGGRVSGMFVLTDAAGKIVGWSDPEKTTLPKAGSASGKSEALVPSKPKGAVRVMSYNVLKSSLTSNPAPFGRLIQVVQPDIVLFQEWDTDAASATSWLSATVNGQTSWHARAGKNVVIVSSWPMEAIGPEQLSLPVGAGSGPSPDVRFIAARVKTNAGDVIVGTTHLKCCGTAGSAEDERRIAEANIINQSLRGTMGSSMGGPPAMRVLGGDLNLVGSRAPLDLLRAGLDGNGTELGVAEARVLGDSAFYTWRDDATDFPPGRLDYLLYGETSAHLINAFVLDTRRLGDRALASMGLNRGDTDTSDHLPVVIDIAPR